MKAKLLGALTTSVLLSFAAPYAHGAKVSVSLFYDALDPLGDWTETADYGYVWHPRGVAETWRPYTEGSWAYTDAGWTWVSDEPFGWATYHYGRWVDLETTGWAWAPDSEWGPAWVSWRNNDRYIGWAPLPPEARFEASVGFKGWVDGYFDIGPTSYSFVSVRDLGSPHLRTAIVEPRENLTILSETRNITNITYENNFVHNGGPQYDVVVRSSSQPIRRLRLERDVDIDVRASLQSDRFASRITGDSLRVVAPRVEITRDTAPRKVAQRATEVRVNRGWQGAGDPQQIERLRAQVASEEKPPTNLPARPRLRGSDQDGVGASGRPSTENTTPGAPERPGARTAERPPSSNPPRNDGREPGRPAPNATTPDEPRNGPPTTEPGRPGNPEPRNANPPDRTPPNNGGPNTPRRPGASTDEPTRPTSPDTKPDTKPDTRPDRRPDVGTDPQASPGTTRRPAPEPTEPPDTAAKKPERKLPPVGEGPGRKPETDTPKRKTPDRAGDREETPAEHSKTNSGKRPDRLDADATPGEKPTRPEAAERPARKNADEPAEAPKAKPPVGNEDRSERPKAERPAPAGRPAEKNTGDDNEKEKKSLPPRGEEGGKKEKKEPKE